MKRLLLCVFGVLLANIACAQVTIDIEGSKTRAIQIAVVPFASSAQLPHQIHEVINNDLKASGKFDPIDSSRFLSRPSREEDVRFKDWRLIGAEALVVGEVVPIGTDAYNITFLFYDVTKQERVGGFRFTANANQLRNVAHEISDYAYEKLTGKKGAFNTRVAFVKKVSNKLTQLQISDWDGYGAKSVVSSSQPILSPAWSPAATDLAFVTYQGGNLVIKTINLNSGSVQTVASSRRGFNSAPAWSPDGSRLAFSSSRTGNPEIYVLDLNSKRTQKLTNHWGIDTEPSWSPDGSRIVFSSSRSGKPNIYEVSSTGGTARRLTFEGKENTEASYAPDGKEMVYVTEGGSVAMMNRGNNRIRLLSNSGLDESPSFSPNGDMVLYASKQGYNGQLVVSSADGRAQQTLKFLSGDVREPAWSPYNRGQ